MGALLLYCTLATKFFCLANWYSRELRERSNTIWRFRGGGLFKPSECRHMEEGRIWPNYHIT